MSTIGKGIMMKQKDGETGGRFEKYYSRNSFKLKEKILKWHIEATLENRNMMNNREMVKEQEKSNKKNILQQKMQEVKILFGLIIKFFLIYFSKKYKIAKQLPGVFEESKE